MNFTSSSVSFPLLFPTQYAIKHCCNIFKTNLGHGLSSFFRKVVKVLIEAVGVRVMIEGFFPILAEKPLRSTG